MVTRKTNSAAPAQHPTDPGVVAICALLRHLKTLPGVVRPGFDPDDDDSTRYDHETAGRLVELAMADAPPAAFAHALGTYLVHVVCGSVPRPDEAWFSECMAEREGIPATPGAGQRAPNVKQAAFMFDEIATRANTADRSCYFGHSEFDDDEAPPSQERVQIELLRLRTLICHLGWLADLGHKHLTGAESGMRGEGRAEDWLLPPGYIARAEVPSHG